MPTAHHNVQPQIAARIRDSLRGEVVDRYADEAATMIAAEIVRAIGAQRAAEIGADVLSSQALSLLRFRMAHAVPSDEPIGKVIAATLVRQHRRPWWRFFMFVCVIASAAAMLAAQTSPSRAAWPPLPKDFRGDFTLDMATMKKLAGDSIALPIAGQFKTLSILAVEEDGTVRIKDLVVDARLSDQSFTVTIHALHSHTTADARGRFDMKGEGAAGAPVPFVWHDFHVQPRNGSSLHLIGVYRDGALLGYAYDRAELGSLAAGAALPVFGTSGWHVVTVTRPLANGTLTIDGGSRLRLIEVSGDRAGLAPE